MITSASNTRLKRAVSLRDSKDRRREGRILIDGPDLIDLALMSGIVFEELLVRLDWVEGLDARGLDRLRTWHERSPHARITAVGPAAFAKMQYGQRDEEAIAIATPPDTSIAAVAPRLRPKENGRELMLVLDRMEKPGNLGAMMRSADAAGVEAVLVSDPICEIWNPNAIRSSLGTVFTVPLIVGSQTELADWLHARKVHIFTARTEQGVDYAAMVYPKRIAIVVGNESQGLQERWRVPGATSISIPMRGTVDSLNASVSGAILLFEVARQARSP